MVFIGFVWTEAVSMKKKLRFQIKTDSCGQGLKPQHEFWYSHIFFFHPNRPRMNERIQWFRVDVQKAAGEIRVK